MSWSGGVTPTGRDEVSGIICAIGEATVGVWRCLERANKELCRDLDSLRLVYSELSPILDRVGRLNADASRLLHFIGNGGRLNEVVECMKL